MELHCHSTSDGFVFDTQQARWQGRLRGGLRLPVGRAELEVAFLVQNDFHSFRVDVVSDYWLRNGHYLKMS